MTLALMALALLTTQDPKIALKWKFEKGQTLRWEMSQKTAIESDAITFDLDFCFTLKQIVKEVTPKGEATLETTIERLRFSVAAPFGDSTYDSAKDKTAPDDPLGQALAVMHGESFTMTTDSTGSISKLVGFDKIAAKMAAPLDDGEPAKGIINQLYTDDVQRMMLQQAFVQLPPEPIAAGNSWKNDLTIELPLINSLKFAIAGTLKAVRKGGDGGEAEIDQVITVTAGSGGMFELGDSKGTRKAIFHIERGTITQSTMKVEIGLKMGDSEVLLILTNEMKPLSADVPSKDTKK